jgi:hypothetical protein
MSKGKRVTGTLGLLLATVGALGLASAACEPSYDPNQAGPPYVAKVISFLPDDPTVNTNLYVTDNSNCAYDNDGGAYDIAGTAGPTWGFRIVLSELIDGDQVEALDEQGLGTEVYTGFVEITTPTGATVTSALDPTLQLTPDTLSSVYQPAGGSGCYETVDTIDLDTGNPIPGPAFITYLGGVPSLPSGTDLTLWLRAVNGDKSIVDKGGTVMDGDFRVDFATDPMIVDCPSIDACNVSPSVYADDQPVDPLDASFGFDVVTVQFNTAIGVPDGVYLYDAADPTAPVSGVVASVDATIPDPDQKLLALPNAVTLTKGVTSGATPAYVPITFTPGATYWVVVTSDVLDAWGVPATLTDVADENGDPLDPAPCDALAAAGIAVDNCIWAGTFTVADAT